MTFADHILQAAFDPSQTFFAQVRERIRAARTGEGARATALDRCIDELAAGRDISDDDARAALRAILAGGVAEDAIGAFLLLLDPLLLPPRTLAAFVEVVHENAKKVAFSLPPKILADTCGTGGDSRGTFNVSTTVMFILAAGGVPVAKHGNRAFTSRCGSADVLQTLGVRIDLGPVEVATCIEETGAGFMFAPKFHESFKNVQDVRKKLGSNELPPSLRRKTIFNVLGPLANPARANRQVIGVFDEALTVKFADVLKRGAVERALVAYGRPVGGDTRGFDEFSVAGTTAYADLKAGEVTRGALEPEDAGVARVADPDSLAGGDKDENARILRAILAGAESAGRTDFALLNAGAGFYVADKTSTIREGVRLAREVVASGAATRTLEALVEVSNKLAR
jgi:anthranilate phosphoribosyltransferase